MNDLRDRLHEADPVARETPLGEHDAQRMRRAIIAAADAQRSSSAGWRGMSWATVSVAVAITVAIGISRWFEPREQSPLNAVREVPSRPAASEPRRQMQLIAPGGTRVIWVFNEDFKP